VQQLSRGGKNRQPSRTPRRCLRRYYGAFVTHCVLCTTSVIQLHSCVLIGLWVVMPCAGRIVPTFERNLLHPSCVFQSIGFFLATTLQLSNFTYIFLNFVQMLSINSIMCSQKVFCRYFAKYLHQNMFKIQAADWYEVCVSYQYGFFVQ
jgi:hypothetical protein